MLRNDSNIPDTLDGCLHLRLPHPHTMVARWKQLDIWYVETCSESASDGTRMDDQIDAERCQVARTTGFKYGNGVGSSLVARIVADIHTKYRKERDEKEGNGRGDSKIINWKGEWKRERKRREHCCWSSRHNQETGIPTVDGMPLRELVGGESAIAGDVSSWPRAGSRELLTNQAQNGG